MQNWLVAKGKHSKIEQRIYANNNYASGQEKAKRKTNCD